MSKGLYLGLVLILLLIASCAAPPVVKIEEKKNVTKAPATAKNATPNEEEVVEQVINHTEDEQDKEVKKLLEESQKMTAPKTTAPAVVAKNVSKKPREAAPSGMRTVKGVIDLAPKSTKANETLKKTESGAIIIESSKGFKGWIGFPKGTISLKLTNSTEEKAKAELAKRLSNPTPYEWLINASKKQ